MVEMRRLYVVAAALRRGFKCPNKSRCAFSFCFCFFFFFKPQVSKHVSLNTAAKATGNVWRVLLGDEREETTQKNEIRDPGERFCLLTPLVKRHLAGASPRANAALAAHSPAKGPSVFEGRRA